MCQLFWLTAYLNLARSILKELPVFNYRHSCLYLVIVVCTVPAFAQHNSDKSAQQIWDDLAAGNRRYVSGKSSSKDFVAQRQALVKTQHPDVAVLSCSDSRVSPEIVFDKGLGELFVVRSAGEDDDPIAIGSLEYSVEHLGSTVIVVMGHQSCGAVTAACSGGKPESPNLDALLSPIASSCQKIDAKKPGAIDLAIRDHVHSVALELVSKSEMLKKAIEEGKLTIVEAYYSLETGEVSKLR